MRIQEIELDGGIDHHHHVEDVFEAVLGDLSVLDQQLLLDDAGCEIVVDTLLGLLLVELARFQGHDERDRPSRQEQAEQQD